MNFGKRLDAALSDRGRLCVGIDPHPALLQAWGLTDDVEGLARFADICVSAFADLAAVVKPQSGLFEPYGSGGIAVLERTVAACRSAGALALLDVKRGDIGTTMTGYARAYLDPAAPLAVDAITASPFLGVGALEPAFALAEQHDAGVFVLAYTSNPEGAPVQQARTGDGTSVGAAILRDLAARNGDREPFGPFGAVVGATVREAAGLETFNGPFLVPGIGAQGGGAEDVRGLFGAALPAVVPAVSREILRHGPAVAALRSAAAAAIEEFAVLQP